MREEDIPATLERIDRLETRCQTLESLVDQLVTRIIILEQPPVTPLDTVGDLTPVGMSKEEVPRESPGPHTGQTPVDIDDLLREAQQVGRGIYDQDMQDVINLYAIPDTEVRIDIDEDYCLFGEDDFRHIGQVLDETSPTAPTTPVVAPAAEVTTSVPAGEDGYGPPEDEGTPTHGEPLHLVLGDSIAVYLTLQVRPGEQILNLAVRGNTWEKEERLLKQHLAEWREECSRRGAAPGRVFVWLGGNDAYGRPGSRSTGLDSHVIRRVLSAIIKVTDSRNVVLAGPTPRLWADADRVWEQTAAFSADRQLQAEAGRCGASFVRYVGRSLTCMRRRRHVVRQDVVRYWFAPDGIHLNEEGHRRLTERLKNVFVTV